VASGDTPVRLTDLEIRDVGVIAQAALRLGPGLNVLTGETGAGKTMVVSSLQWLLGGRADRDRVRRGAAAAVVQARVEGVPASAADWVDPDDGELLVLREIGGRGEDGGRSRARLSGRLAPVSALAEVLGGVVVVHSQHESVRLADPAVQRELLDRYGGEPVLSALEAYRAAHARWRAATRELADAEGSVRQDAREADRLQAEVDEIAAVDPADGEEDELDERIGRLQHVEDLRAAAVRAAAALTDDAGARDALGTAVAALREVVAHDPALVDPLGRLEGALAEVQDVGFDLSSYAAGLDADPQALEDALARRAAVGRLLRKYGPGTAEVRAYLGEALARLALVGGGEDRLARLRERAADAEAEVRRLGERLRDARAAAGRRLAAAVDAQLADLSMPGARATVAVEPAEPAAHGADRVELLLSSGPGQPTLPLARAASGGERSRVALAVEVALADVHDVPVLVFDEVDAGIGGDAALAVGRALARLARDRQVLCVTHLAQLAAFADVHFVVDRHVVDGATSTSVRRLGASERVAELSRMLSGQVGGEAAAAHARQLLAAADRA
jgi:DNA repair protein RecN (Recombination protein N)